jgi:AcrR family transcriptional regulator
MQILHWGAYRVYRHRMSSSPERRRLAARRALSHAAIALAAERGGLETVSVDDIAAAGDVSRRTFFNYFPTKGDAVAWPLAAFRDRLLAALATRPTAEPIWAALEASAADALTDRATDLGDLAGAGRLVIGSPEVLGPRSGAESVPALDQQIAARTGTDLRADVYPALTAVSAGTGIRVAVQRWAEHGGPVGDHLAQVFALIRGGLPDPRFVIDRAGEPRNSDADGGPDSSRFSGPLHP